MNHIRIIKCGLKCSIREDCNIFRVDGGSGTCIFGLTFWPVIKDSDSGLEAYVEQHSSKMQLKLTYTPSPYKF